MPSNRLAPALALCALVLAACGATANGSDDDDGGLADAAADDDDAAPVADAALDPDPDAAPAPDAAHACPDGGALEDGVCVRHVPCVDAAPDQATSIVVDVPIRYVDGAWTEPAACLWTCDVGCASGGACVTDPPDLGYDPPTTGSRWFGGDDRDLDGDGAPDVRSVGAGESFELTDPVMIERVRIGFATGFYSAATGVPHSARVTLELRSADGTILASETRMIGTAFTGGWIGWDLNVSVPAGSYLVTAYAPGVFADNNFTAGTRTDYAAGFASGVAYVKELANDGAMDEWTGWQADPAADHAFGVATACP